MGFTKKTLLLGAALLTVNLVPGMARFAVAAEPQLASEELSSGDWSKAEEALLSGDIAPDDQVFAKLNLAFVYSTTGRKDQAVALYKEILDSADNPYALTNSGEPRRVKSIAKLALNRLGIE